MNIWGALFLAPVALLVIISPAEMLPVLGLGAVGYAALLWLVHKAIGKK